jgi:hypothetical protein
MTKRRTLLLGITFIVSITIAYTGGYVIGVISGYDNAFIVHAPYQSLAVLSELRSLRNGEINDMIKLKEGELNRNILLRSEYYKRITPHLLDLYLNLFLFPDDMSKPHFDRDYMYMVAKHRIEYPIYGTMPKLVEWVDASTVQAIEENLAEYRKEVKETLVKELRYQLKLHEDKYAGQKDETTREVIGELRKYIEIFEKSIEEQEQN